MTENHETTVSAATLASWLGLSDRAVRDLAEKGFVVRAERGRYDLQASIRKYASHLRDVAAGRNVDPALHMNLTGKRASLAEAQAEGQKIKNAQARGELVSIVEVESRWSDIIAKARSRFLALPRRIRDVLPQLSSSDVLKIDVEIRKVLTELGSSKATEVPSPARR
ncbi:hypothetical protein [Lichenifustis flavocetrariae]|uniref:Uncharacterized protein n=1 Tax=Lichenifustis flavocetrariae TaxID=2949735 RepID=A0AA41YT88_9HYPH|nr:hypothetical protein [Lichenifustis flavocetrariae]MCW6506900.1 hypothetical protein [Lichenifustis flavocetrariae]